MLLEFVVEGGRLAVDHDHAAHGPAVGSYGTYDSTAERGVEVAIEQIGGLHHVHVAVDESQTFLHGRVLLICNIT